MAILPVTTRECPTVYACATMWHESTREMSQLVASLLRLEAEEMFTIQTSSTGYRLEVHIFFDDALNHHGNLNRFSKQLLKVLKDVSGSVYGETFNFLPVQKYRTPYGGRIDWQMKGGHPLIVHLKDGKVVRGRKRWSQVLYFHYLLEWQSKQRGDTEALVLTLDGDVQFEPLAVIHLLHSLESNPEAAVVCGRTHPLGSGAIVWMQRFEYAIAHWLVKSMEDLMGGVLCAPGCFSLFRGSALLQPGILERFRTESATAVEAIQCDQGEDRWLCSMLLQLGHKVTFNPCAHVYTFVPQSVGEFFHQRLRWNPTMMTNYLEVLKGCRGIMGRKKWTTLPFVLYLVMSIAVGLLDLGISAVLHMELWRTLTGQESLLILHLNIVFPLAFLPICFVTSDSMQIKIGTVFAVMSSAVQITLLAATALQTNYSALNFELGSWALYMTGLVLVGALHGTEMTDVPFAVVYIALIPSMHILRTIYILCNFNQLAWGTRETPKIFALKGANGVMENDAAEDWVEDLAQTELGHLPEKEQAYLEWLTSLYLSPHGENGRRFEKDLRRLRNRVLVLIILMNGCFIYSFYNLNIHLGEMEMSLAGLYFLMMIQIICILLHRVRTLLYNCGHINKCVKDNSKNRNASESAVVVL